MQSKDTPKEF